MTLRSDALTDDDAQLLAEEGFVPHPARFGRWVDTTNNNLVLGEAEALERARKDRARREGAGS